MNYSSLRLLCQGYLTIDLPEEYGDPWLAVDDYLRSEPAAIELVGDIEEFLRVVLFDDLEDMWTGELGSGYMPGEGVAGLLDFLRELIEYSRRPK